MITTNFHTHSIYCDGDGTLLNYIDAAINLNMTALGFSSHAPLPFETGWAMKKGELMSYCQSVQFLKSKHGEQIDLFLGLEIDYIPGVISPNDAIFKRQNLDYCVGSVHFVSCNDNSEYWTIDASISTFEQGLNQIFHGDIKKAVTQYYRLIQEMVLKTEPPVIGHLDIIKKFNKDEKYFSEKDEWYKTAVKETLDTIAQSRCIVEVNTRGLLSPNNEIYPSPWVLKECLERNIPITLNADAHTPDQLQFKMAETIPRLQELGFKQYHALHVAHWKPTPLA